MYILKSQAVASYEPKESCNHENAYPAWKWFFPLYLTWTCHLTITQSITFYWIRDGASITRNASSLTSQQIAGKYGSFQPVSGQVRLNLCITAGKNSLNMSRRDNPPQELTCKEFSWLHRPKCLTLKLVSIPVHDFQRQHCCNWTTLMF